jgi:integrase
MARPSSTSLPFLTCRKDTGKFAYWRVLPSDVIPYIAGSVSRTWATSKPADIAGKIVKISLATGDDRTARDRWLAVHSQVEGLIADARAKANNQDNRSALSKTEREVLSGQLLHDRIAMHDRARAMGEASPMEKIIAGIRNGQAPGDAIVTQGDRKFALAVEQRNLQRDQLTIEGGSRAIEMPAIADDLTVQVRRRESDGTSTPSQAQDRFVVRSEMSNLLHENGIRLDDAGERRMLALSLLDSKQAALDEIHNRMTGRRQPTPPRPSLINDHKADASEDMRAPLLSEALANWKRASNQTPKNADDRAIYVNRFIALYGDLPVDKITKRHVSRFRDYHLDMPRNIPHRLRGAHPDQIVAWATATPDTQMLSRSSINNKAIAGLSAVLAHAMRDGVVEHNAAAGTKLKVSEADKIVRLPFEAHHLQAMFGLPLFIGANRLPEGAKGESGFWVPVIALLSGMRIEEICQLHVADVKTKDGINYFDVTTIFTKEDDGAEEKHAKSLKTSGSRREVPIHPMLTQMGLMDYVAEQRERPAAVRLFPLLEPYRGRYSKNLSRWWARQQDQCVTKSAHFCFHSFRHNFVSALKNAGIEKSVIQGLVGHAAGDVTDRYGLPHILSTRAAAVMKVAYPTVNFTMVRRPSI